MSKGENSLYAKGGVSETGSDIIQNVDKKRNRGRVYEEVRTAFCLQKKVMHNEMIKISQFFEKQYTVRRSVNAKT